MTPTDKELWNDKEFIKKRLDEQQFYLWDILIKKQDGDLTEERAEELRISAIEIGERFVERLKELEQVDVV